jgi:hypothetical protein
VWARIVSGVIAEYPVIVRDGETPDQCYAPAFVAECVTVPSGIAPAVGWAYASGAFTAPVVQQQPAIRTQLAELDTAIPRGLEDMWAATGFDTTKLPAATQGKLAQKGTLRTQLAALIAAGTP